MLSFEGLIKFIWTGIISVFTGITTINSGDIAAIPAVLEESSGLILTADTTFWSMNDSGGRPVLYSFDKKGKLLDSIVVKGASNKDWEDITTDDAGNIYIGDFGNNNNNRRDLKVYILRKNSNTAEIIEYIYPDQQDFPANANFNMEGFLYFGDSLYLFSKNNMPGSGYSKIYSLPATAGNYCASLLDSIYTGTPVTGAAINNDASVVALMSYGRIILITDFEERNFHTGRLHYISIPTSQTESVAFLGKYLLFYTNEGGKLFQMDIQKYISKKSGK